ncbi:hypothetical protein [Bacillus cereus]|uniref:hypothetical protein n=1 Tax=Bacillus cereus TaxID=1396 RepID=UPI00065BFEF3|nr:hypothetical protein [Bacillus cereus]KMQ32189.1 hypothetical protein TU58_01505 [Bacillus cereus]
MGVDLQIQHNVDMYYGPENSKGQCFWGNLGNLARHLSINEDEIFNSTWCIRLEESANSNIVFWKENRILQERPNLLKIKRFSNRKEAWDFELTLIHKGIPFIIEYDYFYTDPSRSISHGGLNFAVLQGMDLVNNKIVICNKWNYLGCEVELSIDEYQLARNLDYTDYSKLVYLDPEYYIPLTTEEKIGRLVLNAREMLQSGIPSLENLKEYLRADTFSNINQVKYGVVPLQVFHWETYEFLKYYRELLLKIPKSTRLMDLVKDFERLSEEAHTIRASILKNFIMKRELFYHHTSNRYDRLIDLITSVSGDILLELDNKEGQWK